MLKTVMHTRDGRKIVYLGMTAENVSQLQAGIPLLINLEQLDLGEGQLLINYGETLQDLADELRAAGVHLPPIYDPAPGEAVVHRFTDDL